MRTVDTLLKTMSALAATPAAHNALAVYVVMQRFAPAKVPQPKLTKLTGLQRATITRATKTLTDLGLVADNRVVPEPSEASDAQIEALSVGLLRIDRNGAVESLTGEAPEQGVEALSKSKNVLPGEHAERLPTEHVFPSKSAESAPTGGNLETCSETRAPQGALSEEGATPVKSSNESDLTQVDEALELPLDSIYLGKKSSNKSSSKSSEEVSTETTTAGAAARRAALLGLLDQEAWEIWNYWRSLVGWKLVDPTTLPVKGLESYLAGPWYKAIVKALRVWGLNPEQLKRIAANAQHGDDWAKKRFQHHPTMVLKDLDRAEAFLHMAKPKVAQDRRGLGLGMKRPGEADTDVVELF